MLYAVAANAQPVPGVSTKTLTPKEVRATLNKLGFGKLANAWGLTGYKSLYQQRCVVELQLDVYSTPWKSSPGIFRSDVTGITSRLNDEQPKGCPRLPAPKVSSSMAAAYGDRNSTGDEAPATPVDMFWIDDGVTDNDLKRAKEAIRLVRACAKSSKPCKVSIDYYYHDGWIQKHMNLISLSKIRGIDLLPPPAGYKPGLQVAFDAGQETVIVLHVQSRSGPIRAVNFFIVVP